MSDSSPSSCPNCGAPLESDGSCPRCLMLAAMEPTAHSAEATRQPPPSLETVAAAFPQLEILELIGQGGMGSVFKARQPKLNRLVALKLLPASLAERDAAFAERFEREGQLLARLHHPNIVAVHDSGAAGEFFFLIMEFVDGVNLRQAMRARRFAPAQALAIVPRICDALQYAHDEGVLHRDIKPENILLDAKGRVKLADFGIAKLLADSDTLAAAATPADTGLTQSGTALGTPSYMAPEQRDTPNDIDHRADIYSLGVVFYELLTGELPRERFTPPSAKSDADPRVDAIVQQALEKERSRRQQSAGEVKTQVETIGSAAAVPSTATTPRRPTAAVALAIVLLVLAIAVPTVGVIIHNRSIQLISAQQQTRIVLLQQEFMAAGERIGEADANAGRAASRAGNSALPDDVRAQAREEQQLHEQRAKQAEEQPDQVNAKLAETTATQVDAKPWRAVLILLSMLPFAIAGAAVLARSGRVRAPVGNGISPDAPPARGRPVRWTMVVHVLLAFACLWVIGSVVPRMLEMLKDMLGDAAPLPTMTRVLAALSGNFLLCLLLTVGALGVDLGLCILLSRNTRLGLRLWNGAVILIALLFLGIMMIGVSAPLRPAITLLASDGPQAGGTEKQSLSGRESWSYTPRHLTKAKFSEWRNSPKGEPAELGEGTSFKFEAGVFTLTGPRERVRMLATMLRVLDLPEVKNALELPFLNMPPEFFLRIALPGLLLPDTPADSPKDEDMTTAELARALQEFSKDTFTDTLRESLKSEGITAPQLARALSAHVLELEKATFVNNGAPFESIVHSPGASIFYEATVPCADQPDKPLTLRIQRTTQQMGTHSHFAGFAPWLLAEAKRQSKEPIRVSNKGDANDAESALEK